MKDPSTEGLSLGGGYPAHWTRRLDQLLQLPGEWRQHALVIISYQLRWLFAIDPEWTELQLLPACEDPGSDGDAFWDGVVWAGRRPDQRLLVRLKAGLLTRAGQPHTRQRQNNIIAAILLAGWGGAPDAAEPAISEVELREVLIRSDDELRVQILLHLRQWASSATSHWHERIIPFLRSVWPKQRTLRTPTVSSRLADLALASGELTPEVVQLILPRLVPVPRLSLHMLPLNLANEKHPARIFPRETLDLLWALLTEDPRFWPYGIEVVLDFLAAAPETAADTRLSDLRRRRRY
jgi:hypothetical protein